MTKILTYKSDIDLDYPICRPSLDLDFTQEELDSRITFTRGSTATRVNRNRLIESVAANQPRFDYDPVTGECKGLLIEESRSNNFLQSSRLDTSWLITVSGGSGTFIDGERVTSSVLSVDAIYDASLSTSSTFILRNSVSGQPFGTLTGLSSGATRNINSQTNIGGQSNISAFLTTETTAPDGTNNAVLCNPTTVGSQLRFINKRFITSTAATYTFSVFFKNKNITNNNVAIYIGNQTSASNVVASFTLSTKTFSAVGQNGGWTGSVGYQDYNNGWGRIWVTATTTASSHTFIDGIFWIGGYQGTHTSVGSLYAWGMQLEEGSFPTSYIPTSASTVTRSADNASITGTNFSSWFNQSEGTLYASLNHFTNRTSSSFDRLVALTGSDVNRNVISIYTQPYSGGGAQNQFLPGVSYSPDGSYVVDIGGLNVSSPQNKGRAIIAYQRNNYGFTVNGVKPSFVGKSEVPTCDRLLIYGSARFQPAPSGTISRLTYYPRRLKDNQLVLLTQ
jgi:hypothetical protein